MTQLIIRFSDSTLTHIADFGQGGFSGTNPMIIVIKAIRTLTNFGLKEAKDLWEEMKTLGKSIVIEPAPSLTQSQIDAAIRDLKFCGLVVTTNETPAERVIEVLKTQTKYLIDENCFDDAVELIIAMRTLFNRFTD